MVPSGLEFVEEELEEERLWHAGRTIRIWPSARRCGVPTPQAR